MKAPPEHPFKVSRELMEYHLDHILDYYAQKEARSFNRSTSAWTFGTCHFSQVADFYREKYYRTIFDTNYA